MGQVSKFNNTYVSSKVGLVLSLGSLSKIINSCVISKAEMETKRKKEEELRKKQEEEEKKRAVSKILHRLLFLVSHLNMKPLHGTFGCR